MSIKQNFYSLPQFQQVGLLYYSDLRPILRTSISEKVQFFTKKKAEGSDLFNKKEYCAALEKYYQGLALFKWIENKNPNWSTRQINDLDLVYKSEEQTEEVKSCLITSYLNIAICSLKLEQWKEAESACDEVLKIDDKNVKALYRKAQAISSPSSAGPEEYKKSMKLLKSALTIDPKNIVVIQKLNEIKELSEEKVISTKVKYSPKDAAPNPFFTPINELDSMISKWEYVANHVYTSNESSEIVKFQKDLNKIKKYKNQLKENLTGMTENEVIRLKTNKFGIDIADYIASIQIKESRNKGLEFIRLYPLLHVKSWQGWHYLWVGVLVLITFLMYKLESKHLYRF
jgi:tetratricopeptide (TPR) repeat protein